MLAGRVSEKKYCADAEFSRYYSCGCRFWVGMLRLSEGDRPATRKAFQAAVDFGIFHMYSCEMGRIMLARMDSDPTWPTWIPVKK